MTSSAVNTYPNDRFLNKTFVATEINKYMQGNLIAESESVNRNIGNNKSVEWIEEKFSDAGDELRFTDLNKVELEQASIFEHVKFSQFEVKSAMLKTYGIEIDFSEECMENQVAGLDWIQRGYQRAAYFLAKLINDLVFNSMTESWYSAGAATEADDHPWNMAVTNPWSDTTNRDIIGDTQAITLMIGDTENYDYDVDRSYVRRDNYSEMTNYLQTKTNVPWARDPVTNQWNGMLEGVKFNKVHKLSGIPASTGLFMSRGVKPTKVFERTNPRYAAQVIADNAGNTLPSSYHVHRYFSDSDHVTHIQIWREIYPVTDRWGRKSIGILRAL